MRFMGLLFEKNSRNMVTRHSHGRVVAVQFQALGVRLTGGREFTA
jgi:hypothetical protein